MSDSVFISRQLTGSIAGEQHRFDDSELLSRPENLVILGEAGMGKSRLLESLAVRGVRLVSARSFIVGIEPPLLDAPSTLLIDAIDEAPAYSDGDAVDKVLARLVTLNRPRFILSCRSEEWQAATATELIREAYGVPPLELHLLPFDETQAEEYLGKKLGASKAEEVMAAYRERDLEDWLGNPHTLSMLADVVATYPPPETTTELYDAFIRIALPEENTKRVEARRNRVPEAVKLDALGAAFAAQILSGAESVAVKADHTGASIQLSELAKLPGFKTWEAVSGNRLVQVKGDGKRYTYLHRRLGEWIGAGWLAHHANTPRSKHRLLGSLVFNDIVPASLRGIFGALAGQPAFTRAVVGLDPLAAIEYGDADAFDEGAAADLLDALCRVSEVNPYFLGWNRHRAKSLVRGAVLERAFSVLTDRQANLALRFLIAEQLAGEKLDEARIETLRQILLDPKDNDQVRQLAGGALVENIDGGTWPELLNEVRRQGTHAATRIAANLMLDAGIANFSDLDVTEILFAASGLSLCSVEREDEDNYAAILWRHRRLIPDERLDSLLDLMADYAIPLIGEHPGLEAAEIINLADALIARRLSLGEVAPEPLYRWLRGFGGRDSYHDADNKIIGDFLKAHDQVRWEIQRLWLTECADDHGYGWAAYRMHEGSRHLTLSDRDVAAFLEGMPDDASGWRDALHLIPHHGAEGELSRRAARRFCSSDAEYAELVHGLLYPPKPEWKIKQEKREAKWQREQDKRWKGFRESLESQRSALEAGDWALLVQPAGIYMGTFTDARDIKDPVERLELVCGADLAASALQGFESYLADPSRHQTAEQVAESYAKGRYFKARTILFAALAERLRKCGGIGDLTDEQLVVVNLDLSNSNVGENERATSEAAWSALKQRPVAFERFARLLVEPAVRHGETILMGMHRLTHDGHQTQPEIVEALAIEWLNAFPNIARNPEEYLGDLLIRAKRFPELTAIAKIRLATKALDDERRRYWRAVALISDFDTFTNDLKRWAKSDPDVFWSILKRLGSERSSKFPESYPFALAELLMRTFRERFPFARRPSGVTSGDTNPWDATAAISGLVDRIATNGADDTEATLLDLAKVDDDYRPRVLNALAEWRRNRAEQAFTKISLDALAAILADGDPQSMQDLQSQFLWLLGEVQKLVTSNDTDAWRGFYVDAGALKPKGEEDARDHLVDLLRQFEAGDRFAVEAHIGANRRVDIAYTVGGRRLPIEVKGQWHPDLWTAADTQLVQQQAVDHRAEGYGVYLVLWFGSAGKQLRSPPRNYGLSQPNSPAELEALLQARLAPTLGPAIEIRVLDVSRARG